MSLSSLLTAGPTLYVIVHLVGEKQQYKRKNNHKECDVYIDTIKIQPKRHENVIFI